MNSPSRYRFTVARRHPFSEARQKYVEPLGFRRDLSRAFPAIVWAALARFGMKPPDVLLATSDANFRDLALTLLSKHRLTVVSSPQEAKVLIETARYRLVIATKRGPVSVRGDLDGTADTAVPCNLLTGHWDDDSLKAACAEKQVATVIPLPLAPQTFRETVDGLLNRKEPAAE